MTEHRNFETEEDVKNNSGYLIDQSLKRTNYKYDIQKFIDNFKPANKRSL